jgi:hypothetical protein
VAVTPGHLAASRTGSLTLEIVVGHTFWCEQTRVASVAVLCTCEEPPRAVTCRCGHSLAEHLGNGAFCRYCLPHEMRRSSARYPSETVCSGYRPVLIDSTW